MEKITTFKRIKEIIEPIPADQFCVDTFENNSGQCCFLGHIEKALTGDARADGSGFGARRVTLKFLRDFHNIDADGADVNDFPNVNGYTEPEIKDRLMHMIEDGIIWEENNKKK
jgi:hypothetical protein